jgi:altronate hydrolase
LKDFPGVDGVVAVTHKAGCAMQYGGPDHLQLDRTLAGFARHANVAAYIIIGLGCETGQAAHLIEGEHLINLGGGDRRAPLVLNIQELGGIARTVEAGKLHVTAEQQLAPTSSFWPPIAVDLMAIAVSRRTQLWELPAICW